MSECGGKTCVRHVGKGVSVKLVCLGCNGFDGLSVMPDLRIVTYKSKISFQTFLG
jgi:hypothetical protein